MSAARPETVADLLCESGALARLERELLLAAVCSVDRTALYRHPERVLAPVAAASFRVLVSQRIAGKPIAYLLGRREFWTLTLEVGPDVLIPRPETELLVETALQRKPPDTSVDILDLGTGSGAVALAIAAERPNWRILATDCCPRALDVAQRNAARHGFPNIALRRASWLDGLGGERFDMIVCNPPYVAAGDPAFASGDTRFEPRLALDGGRDGLQAIREIVSAAPSHLRPGGTVLLEHGATQGPAVSDLMRAAALLQIETRRDLAGRERVTLGVLGPV
jgi:release factor glutamine methyltransferase